MDAVGLIITIFKDYVCSLWAISPQFFVVTKKNFFWRVQLWVTDLFFSCVYDTVAYIEFIIFVESEK